MYPCPNGAFPYSIQPSDTLWLIAERYNTTVQAIISANPGINPHNLYVGQKICIYPGYKSPPQPLTPSSIPIGISKSEQSLRDSLRMLWEQHVAWTRMAIISIVSGLSDQKYVLDRLLRNPADMAAALEVYYGKEKASKFETLLTDHLSIAAQLVRAAKAGNSKAAAAAEKSWYDNADEIASFLNSINPYWSLADLKAMLHTHLALTKDEAIARISKDYRTYIPTYDKIEKQALSMANALSSGIVKQFPDKFRM